MTSVLTACLHGMICGDHITLNPCDVKRIPDVCRCSSVLLSSSRSFCLSSSSGPGPWRLGRVTLNPEARSLPRRPGDSCWQGQLSQQPASGASDQCLGGRGQEGTPGEPQPCLGGSFQGAGVDAKAGPEMQSEELGERRGGTSGCAEAQGTGMAGVPPGVGVAKLGAGHGP